MVNDTRNIVLEKIRKGLAKKTAVPFSDLDMNNSAFNVSKESPDILFAEQFSENGGKFVYCDDFLQFYSYLQQLSDKKSWRNIHCWNKDLIEYFKKVGFRNCKIGHLLDRANAGLTVCEAIVGNNGSILISSAMEAGRNLAVFPKTWLVIATVDQVVSDFEEAKQKLESKYEQMPSMFSLISGPAQNRTISLQKNIGGICPEEIYVFFIDTIDLILPKKGADGTL